MKQKESLMQLRRNQIDPIVQKLGALTRESKSHITAWVTYNDIKIQPIYLSKSKKPTLKTSQSKLLRSLKLNAKEFRHLISCYLGKDDYFQRFFERTEKDGSLEPISVPCIVDRYGEPINKDDDLSPKIIRDTQELEEELIALVAEDHSKLFDLTSREFEIFVKQILAKSGYDIHLTPPSKDGGKDILVAVHGDLGNFIIYVECKRYAKTRPVGVDIVRELYGTIEADRVTAGIVATTSRFTEGAREFQRQIEHRMTLIDYFGLIDWLDRVLEE